jgi:hypothetical protein
MQIQKPITSIHNGVVNNQWLLSKILKRACEFSETTIDNGFCNSIKLSALCAILGVLRETRKLFDQIRFDFISRL